MPRSMGREISSATAANTTPQYEVSKVVARMNSESAGNTAMLPGIGRCARSPVPDSRALLQSSDGDAGVFRGRGRCSFLGERSGDEHDATGQWLKLVRVCKRVKWRAAGDGTLLR